jgi:hypothetical protein
VPVNGPGAGKSMRVVHEFRGADEYVIVFAAAERDRPKALDCCAGERRAALVREKCERRGLTVNDRGEVRLFANYSR